MASTELDVFIHQANTNNANLFAVVLDLKNAFPRVWRHHILLTLHKYGLRGLQLRVLENYLNNRTFQVEVASTFLHTRTMYRNPVGFP